MTAVRDGHKKAHIVQRFYFPPDGRHILKEIQSFFNGHIQDIVNIFTLIFNLQSFPIIAFSLTYFARHINISQEVHFNFDDSIPGAGLTTAALDIKTESAFFVSPLFGIHGGGK